MHVNQQSSTEIEITGEAGNVVDLADGIAPVKADAEGSDSFSKAGRLSNRSPSRVTSTTTMVSMKDLAYLNAGAARQQLVESTIREAMHASSSANMPAMDADFSGR